MKNLSKAVKLLFIGMISFTLLECTPNENSNDESSKENETNSVSEEGDPNDDQAIFATTQKLTNTIVLIVHIDSLKDPSLMDSLAYENAVEFVDQKKESLKTYTTKVKKNARVIWAAETSDENSEEIIEIVQIQLEDQEGDHILTESKISGDPNGLAIGRVRREIKFEQGVNEKVQAYTISFKVNGQVYSFDPKLRVLK